MSMGWARVMALVVALPCAALAAEAQKPLFPFSSSGFGVLRALPQSATQVRLSYASVVDRTAPAVVNVYSRRIVRERVNPFDEDFLRMFGGPEGLGLSRERVQQSLGSGVVVRADGIVVTNNHVVEGGERFTVVLADRREFDAELVLADKQSDLAVLRIHPGPQPLPTIVFGDSDEARVGDLVLAIGDPFGVGQTVTNGIISALARTNIGSGGSFIQTDAPINQGNSGGALVTLDGKLVGINTMIYTPSGGSVGIGFAIPANLVRLVVDQALSKGKIDRPWFGATAQAVTPEAAEALGLARPQGVLITAVRPQSPAEKAGLHEGDLLLSINGFPVDDPETVRYRVATQKLDQIVPVVAMTKGVKKTLSLRLTAPPEIPPRDETVLQGQQPLAGATVINLSPAVNEAFNIDPLAEGVMITKTAPGTPAQGYGFMQGDLVLGVNGATIHNVEQLKGALAGSGRRWILRLERGGQVADIQVRI